MSSNTARRASSGSRKRLRSISSRKTWDRPQFSAERLDRLTADGETTTLSYNDCGQLSEASNATGTVKRAYDAAGRLTSETVNGRTVAYRYNGEGERMGYTLASTTIDYERSARGRITAIDASEGRYTFSYDALGPRGEQSAPNGEENPGQTPILGKPGTGVREESGVRVKIGDRLRGAPA